MPLIPKAQLEAEARAKVAEAVEKAASPTLPPGTLIVLVDGDCALCNGFVQFACARDSRRRLAFAAQQSRQGQELLTRYNQPLDLSTMIAIEREGEAVRCLQKSSAALAVLRQLDAACGLWSFVGRAGVFVPPAVRDLAYSTVAGSRYTVFGHGKVTIDSSRLVGGDCLG